MSNSLDYYTTQLLIESHKLVNIAFTNYLLGVDYELDLRIAKKRLREFARMPIRKLISEKDKKAFWINLYNIYARYLLCSLAIKGNLSYQPWIFFLPKINIGGYSFSLDDIQHGILRGNKRALYALFKQFWPWDSRLPLICHQSDYRVHFALNFGAKSCPVERFFHVQSIDLELDKAEYAYSRKNFVIDVKNKTITLANIYRWFKSDFEGIYLNAPEFRKFKTKSLYWDWQVGFFAKSDLAITE